MHYVKKFNINGVDTQQVGCIELLGVPNAATEGIVGLLGIDMLSPSHEVYKCVAVNGGIHTWELLSAGMSMINAKISGEGANKISFLYSNLLIPTKYLVKVGDLILDNEGYLYQITSISSNSCEASYTRTHIGGSVVGFKDTRLQVVNGKLQLISADTGNVLSEHDYLYADEDTIARDASTGVASVRGIKTINDSSLRLFTGTQAEYDALTDEQKQNLFAIIEDDDTREDILSRLDVLDDAVANIKKMLYCRIYNTKYQLVFNILVNQNASQPTTWEEIGDIIAENTPIGGHIPVSGIYPNGQLLSMWCENGHVFVNYKDAKDTAILNFNLVDYFENSIDAHGWLWQCVFN